MPISGGLFNQTLTLQRATETADGQGGMTFLWANMGSFRGRISGLSVDDKLLQNKKTIMATHKIYCDNIDITHRDRIKWGDYYFEIMGITNPSEAYHHLEIDVRELPE